MFNPFEAAEAAQGQIWPFWVRWGHRIWSVVAIEVEKVPNQVPNQEAITGATMQTLLEQTGQYLRVLVGNVADLVLHFVDFQ